MFTQNYYWVLYIYILHSYHYLITNQMINSFPCGWCSDEVENNDDAVECDLRNKWNHTGCQNIGIEKCKNFETIHYPGTVKTVQPKHLSWHYLVKSYKLYFLEALLKFLVNHFQMHLTRKLQKRFKKFVKYINYLINLKSQ